MQKTNGKKKQKTMKMENKNKKTDRRVKYTKMVLKESLIVLLKEKPINKVSIKKLCEAADINRSTFYTHYYDQYDLLQQIEQEFLQDISDYLDNYKFGDNEAKLFQVIKRIFEYIKTNADLCKVLLGETGSITLQKEIMKKIMLIVQQHRMKEWKDNNALDEEMIEYLLWFGVISGISIVQKWLQSDMKKTTGEMSEIVIKLISQGFSAYV